MKTRSEANSSSLLVVAYVRKTWRRVCRGRSPAGTVTWAEPKSSRAGDETWVEHLRFAAKRAKAALGARREQAEVAKILAKRNTILKADLERARQTIKHLRRVEGAYRETSSKMEGLSTTLRTAQRGVQAWIAHLQRMLFETEDAKPAEVTTALILADRPAVDSLATLVNLSKSAHGARAFQYVLPFLTAPRPFPLPWRPDWPALRIVDIGSQELATEDDIYAPLRSTAPVEAIGFDPFASLTNCHTDPKMSFVEVARRDGGRVKTYPLLIGDGREVTFHVNRFDATSSMLRGNHSLATQFGLLDHCLDTVETRSLQSYRMDDVLPTAGEAARVDLLKIDVQGAAHDVLANAPNVLANTLVCHVEVEFAPVYLGEKLFGEIDLLLRAAGFCFVDFFSLGRQRYRRFEGSVDRAFHRGRTLWGDCVYIRGLDMESVLSAEELFRIAVIVHCCYNKQDLAAELLGRSDASMGTKSLEVYISSAPVAN